MNRFEIPHDELARFLPVRIIMRKADDGKLVGITEESFNMNTSRERVHVFWSGTANTILGQMTINAVEDAEDAISRNGGDLIIDPLAPDSPVEINWRYWLDAMKVGIARKYDSRNAPFFEKGIE